jgi:hypothetical protein
MAYEPDTNLRATRKNGQVVQPNVEFVPDNNGWPEPLTDPSTPYRISVTNGKNGESKMDDGLKTSQDAWHLPEGTTPVSAVQPDGLDGQRGSQDSISQKIWSQPGGDSPKASQPDLDGDTPVRSSDPLKTSQMQSDDISSAESGD